MKYLAFRIWKYRGIGKELVINIENNSLVPLVGINECGKTTILQAIFSFDAVNDNEYDGNHLIDTLNLYHTSDSQPPFVGADIQITRPELLSFIQGHNYVEEHKASEKVKQGVAYEKKLIDENIAKQTAGKITIYRNLDTLSYGFIGNDFKVLNPIAIKLVQSLPYILYNDDFMDRPPNYVEIPDEEPKSKSGWLGIYERLFTKTDRSYSLFKLSKEENERRRDSILSDVQEELNRSLTKAWKTFLLGNKGSITVRLKITNSEELGSTKRLEIRIVEKIGHKERHFNVVDRSKGFLWFFNFVMKLEYNPKIIGIKKDTIYLLDEPGSYLHSTAQEKLCRKLKQISEKEGNVIYCTHSHHLLNPEHIPLNKIYIVEKGKDKNIKANPLNKVKLKGELINAYQPILDALQIPSFSFYGSSKPVIAVEGIYDKYAITLMLNNEDKYELMPGTCANSIIKNIQYLNAFSKTYIAIWDNDQEGQKEFRRASKIFGDFEAKKFDLLPLLGAKKRRMEQMFEISDLEIVKNSLGLPLNADYEKVISNLRYANTRKKKEIIGKFSGDTVERFKILDGIIEKRIKEAEKME